MPPPVEVATLCEEHYHPGLGALLNSLVAAGFAGTVRVGHRGPRPAWAPTPRLALAPGVEVRFQPVDPGRHLANHKALFLQEVLAEAGPATQGALYLDPDIVVIHPWPFFAEWVTGGIAVCADIHPCFPASHPVRKAWLALAHELGDHLAPPALDLYVNGGFVGLPRGQERFLADWERYIVAMAQRGPGLAWGPGGPPPEYAGRTSPFMVPDQDALNLAVMAHAPAISLMGPQAMGLAGGWPLMRHAIGGPKPWAKPFVRAALRGSAPTRADEAFLAHARGPVPAVAPGARARARVALRTARVLARLAGT